jgi:hypothetical protein
MRGAGTKKKSYRFTSVLERSDNNLWGCHFRVPAGVAQELRLGKSARVVCSLNSAVEYQCALLAYRKGIFVISVNRSFRARLGLDFGMPVDVVLRKDTSSYGLPVPEELRELFRQDPEGSALFHTLTPGKQRTLLHIAGSLRNPDQRIQRSLAILRHLKAHNGTIDYRKLYASLQDPRGRKPGS